MDLLRKVKSQMYKSMEEKVINKTDCKNCSDKLKKKKETNRV